jgi:hypothetical protein
VLRPRNHKWASQAEQVKWQLSYILGERVDEIYYNRRAPTYVYWPNISLVQAIVKYIILVF